MPPLYQHRLEKLRYTLLLGKQMFGGAGRELRAQESLPWLYHGTEVVGTWSLFQPFQMLYYSTKKESHSVSPLLLTVTVLHERKCTMPFIQMFKESPIFLCGCHAGIKLAPSLQSGYIAVKFEHFAQPKILNCFLGIHFNWRALPVYQGQYFPGSIKQIILLYVLNNLQTTSALDFTA